MGDTLLVFAILGVTIALFVSDRMRLDVVAVLSMLALAVTGILTPAEALAGFSSSIVVMIAALFVVGAGLFRTGVAERFGRALGRAAGTQRAGLTAVLMLGAGALSGIMSSTGTVAVMLPVAVALAWNARFSPSLLLIPLSIGASLGGMLTLIGTPPNLVVADALTAAGYEPFGFFDFTLIGLAALGLGTLVLAVFGRRLLPARRSASSSDAEGPEVVSETEMMDAFEAGDLVRFRVMEGSPLIDRSPADVGMRQRYGVNVVDIRRRGPVGPRKRLPSTGRQLMREGDIVDLQGDPGMLELVAAEQGLDRAWTQGETASVLAEVLLTPRSRLVGRTLPELEFRKHYGVNVLSIQREGEALPGPLADIRLKFADMLLVSGEADRIDSLRSEVGQFVVLAQTASTPARGPLTGRQLAAIAVTVGMMALLALELVAPVIAVLVAAVAMVLTRCLDVEMAYRSINWESVVLIAAIMPMATALEKTGGMELIVGQLGTFSVAGPLALMAALFVVTGVLSQVISNTATALLVAPAALGAAVEIGASPYPFLMAVAIAASSAFATPVASPINMLVLGPGAYRFGDFFRVGVLIQVLLLVLTLLLVPLLFPF
ncbi:MAG: SLC13 family permease [Bacteroidota bacterium]